MFERSVTRKYRIELQLILNLSNLQHSKDFIYLFSSFERPQALLKIELQYWAKKLSNWFFYVFNLSNLVETLRRILGKQREVSIRKNYYYT